MLRKIRQCYEEQVLNLCGIHTAVYSNHLLKVCLQKNQQELNCAVMSSLGGELQAGLDQHPWSQQTLILISLAMATTQRGLSDA